MNREFSKQKTVAFWLLIAIGVSYIGLLTVLSDKAIPAAIAQLSFLLQMVATRCSPQAIFGSPSNYVTLIVGVAIALLWVKVALSAFRSVWSIARTARFIRSLKAEWSVDLNAYVFKSCTVEVFTAGLLSPHIYLSENLIAECTRAELQSILCHESEHQRSRDPLRGLIAQMVYRLMPAFPFRKSIFENYEVLSELSADEYAESVQLSKRDIVSALHKVMSLTDSKLNLAMFGTHNDRIGILVGREKFKTRQFFTLVTLVGVFMMVNAVLLSQTNLFWNCERVVSQTLGTQAASGICFTEPQSNPVNEEMPANYSTPQLSSHNSF